MTRRVFVVDDHPVMREGLANLLERAPDLEFAGEAASAVEAMERLPEAQPDLCVVDLSLPGTNGIELIRQIRSLWPSYRILVVSAHSEVLYAERALRAGAQGFMMKDEPPLVILGAIRSVLEGRIALSDVMRDRLLHVFLDRGEAADEPVGKLSDRELEVFHHLGRGLSTREIAAALFLSPKTVETYRANIKTKLGLKTASELIQRATLWVESLDR